MSAEPTPGSGAPRRRSLALAAFLAAGFALRLIGIASPPYEFHPTRQFQTAIAAQAKYWRWVESPPAWAGDVARAALAPAQQKEPRVMETLAAVAWRLGGGVQLWVPRLIAALFWVAGALVLHRLTVRLYGARGALLAPACFLFFPFAVHLGRAIMPEPLMTLLLLAALNGIVSHAQRPTRQRLLIAAGLSALAVLAKLVAAFPLWGAFLAVSLRSTSIRGLLRDAHTQAFLTISVLPAAAYYGIVTVSSPTLRGIARSNFLPHLWVTGFFWEGWLTQVGRITGLVPFGLAVVAFLLLRDRLARSLLLGLSGGYVVYGLALTYSTATHDYYGVALFVTVMIALGRLGPPVAAALAGAAGRPARAVALAAVLAGAVVVGLLAATAVAPRLLPEKNRTRLAPLAAVACGNQLTSWAPPVPAGLAERAVAIGETVEHSTRTIFLAWEYGAPLCFFGGLAGTYWPDERDVWAHGLRGVPPLAAAERFARRYERLGAEFFIVEDMAKWKRQPDLQALLRGRFPVVAERPDFVVFDLRGGPVNARRDTR